MVIFGDKSENLWRLICPKIEILVTDLTHFADWVIGEFELIFSYAVKPVMLIWREFMEIPSIGEKFSSIWRELGRQMVS